jgi:aminopeptidase YwaD
MRTRLCLVVLVFAAAFAAVAAQEREDRTLLSITQMKAIANEASGERAVHAVLEMVPYPRVRTRAEYEGRFRETEAVARLAKESGFSNVEVESFPAAQRMWQASQAELWLVEPDVRKLYDLNEVAVSIASGSETGDVTSEIVDVGLGGRAEDYAGKDVAGKIVLGSAGAGQLQRLGVFERGAVGVISYNALRADDFPDQLMSQSVGTVAPTGKKVGFGWSVGPRVGRDLALRLGRGEKLKARSIVKSETFPGEMEMVHATIPGDGSSTQTIMVTAHLYEGYLKQGANDDNSGCALSLEMGRTYLHLIADGSLPKPKRTMHFLWVPEISGTNAWLAAHEDVKKTIIADLNYDMDGLKLSLSGSAWVMHRTPDSLPTYLNDLCASVLEFVADTNRERVRYRSVGYGFSWPVVASTGTREPFNVLVEKYYGASDHVVFIGQGIPAVMFITWPDHFYHSSEDTPEKLDPTQFKRATVVGVGCMSLLASASDETALAIAAESLGRGTARMGEAQRKGLSYVADLPFNLTLVEAYKEARNAVRHQAQVEKAVVKSTAQLFADQTAGEKRLAGLDAVIDNRTTALLNEVAAYYKLAAEQRKATATVEPPVTDLERQAARLIVEPIVGPGGGGGMGGGGGRGAQSAALQSLPPAERAAVEEARRKIPGHMTGEFTTMMARKKTVLELRDFISGEFEPVPLADVMAYVKAGEKLGQLKLTEKAEEPVKGAKKPVKK